MPQHAKKTHTSRDVFSPERLLRLQLLQWGAHKNKEKHGSTESTLPYTVWNNTVLHNGIIYIPPILPWNTVLVPLSPRCAAPSGSCSMWALWTALAAWTTRVGGRSVGHRRRKATEDEDVPRPLAHLGYPEAIQMIPIDTSPLTLVVRTRICL